MSSIVLVDGSERLPEISILLLNPLVNLSNDLFKSLIHLCRQFLARIGLKARLRVVRKHH
jgi:hypothetical protein